MDSSSTLLALLGSRSQERTTGICFLDIDGDVSRQLSYAELFADALDRSQRLLASGLRPGRDVVVASFATHEPHIKLFWACCFGKYSIL